MRNVGTLIFAFVVLVSSVVCRRGIFPVGEHPNDIIGRSDEPLKVVRMRAEDLPGVYAKCGSTRQPVYDHLDVVISGTTILGANERNRLIPIWCYDDTGSNFCTMQVGEEGHPAHTPRTYKYRREETTFGMHQNLPENTRYYLLLPPLRNPSSSENPSSSANPTPSRSTCPSTSASSSSNVRHHHV